MKLSEIPIKGYLLNNLTNWNALTSLGFHSKIELPETDKGFMAVEAGNLWLVDSIPANSRLNGKELNIIDVIRTINEYPNLSKAYCKATLGVVCFLLSKGYKMESGFTEDTKYLYFNNEGGVFGAEACSPSIKDKSRIKLIEGHFVNCCKPVIDFAEAVKMIGTHDVTESLLGIHS